MPTGTSALPGSSSVFRQLHGVKNRRRPRSGGFQPPTDAPICIFHVRAQPRCFRITFGLMPTGTSALPGSSFVFRQLLGAQNCRRPRSGGFQPPTDASIFIFHVRAQPRCFRIRFEFMPTGTSALPGSSSVFRLPSITWLSKIAEGQGAAVSNRRQMLRSSSFTFELNLDAFE